MSEQPDGVEITPRVPDSDKRVIGDSAVGATVEVAGHTTDKLEPKKLLETMQRIHNFLKRIKGEMGEMGEEKKPTRAEVDNMIISMLYATLDLGNDDWGVVQEEVCRAMDTVTSVGWSQLKDRKGEDQTRLQSWIMFEDLITKSALEDSDLIVFRDALYHAMDTIVGQYCLSKGLRREPKY